MRTLFLYKFTFERKRKKKITFVFMFLSSLSLLGQIDLEPDTVRYEQNPGGAIDTFDSTASVLQPSKVEGQFLA